MVALCLKNIVHFSAPAEIVNNPDDNVRIIGGEFNRWFNITSTIISAQATVPDQGDYICEVCVARDTPFEMCHRGTLTLHLLGAPPELVMDESKA